MKSRRRFGLSDMFDSKMMTAQVVLHLLFGCPEVVSMMSSDNKCTCIRRSANVADTRKSSEKLGLSKEMNSGRRGRKQVNVFMDSRS